MWDFLQHYADILERVINRYGWVETVLDFVIDAVFIAGLILTIPFHLPIYIWGVFTEGEN